jgi:cysteine-rich repeat protein
MLTRTRSRSSITVLFSFFALAVLAGAGSRAWAHTDPPGCFKTGPTLLITEFFDTDNDGIGDTPVDRDKLDGETIYYQATLAFAAGTNQCGYEGGTICIDPPGGAPCIDVTPFGGVPLICIGCPDGGVPSVDSLQLAYVVNKNDVQGPNQVCPNEVRGIAEYRNGTSHRGTNDMFPIDADTPICNAVQYCGDGIFNPNPPFNEQCDDGNTNNFDDCRNDCTLPTCGDGITDPPNETCDPPGSPAGAQGNPCRNDCTVCGDGVPQLGEECDDGNAIDTDGCHNDCTLPSCGDGNVVPPETCDPPGSPAGVHGNPCRANCTVCGDGIPQGGEECDDGNTVDTDGCHNDCTQPECGDGIVDPGESCDPPGSPAGAHGNPCRANCTVCGDGVVQIGEQCDDGNTNNADLCHDDCTQGLDHFACYEAEGLRISIPDVTLNDVFSQNSVTLTKRKRLCNPADKNGEDPTAPSHPDHLLGYIIKPNQKQFTQVPNVTITNQFGSFTMTLVKPNLLLVPTAKNLTMPPGGPPVNPAVGHFKCYKIRGPKFSGSATFDDQFVTNQGIDLRRPLRVCVPADKNGEGIPNPNDYLMCFKVRPQTPFRGPENPLFVHDQFGPDSFVVNHSREFCVPSKLAP